MTSRTALITGSNSGFGLLAAVDLAQAGMHVLATMRSPEKRGALDAAAAAAGSGIAERIEVVRLDITDPGSIADAVSHVEREHGALDVLVNNAGYGIGGFFEDLSLDEIRRQFETNFFGAVALTHAVIPGMRERRSGRIVNVSSVSGRFGQPAMTAYCSSKFALEGFSESLRYEVLPYGVHVSLIEPGSFPTPIFEENRQVAARADDPDSPYYESSLRLERFVTKKLERTRNDPRSVARAITRAATARRPRRRYIVGSDARMLVALRALLPAPLLERAVLGTIGHRSS